MIKFIIDHPMRMFFIMAGCAVSLLIVLVAFWLQWKVGDNDEDDEDGYAKPL